MYDKMLFNFVKDFFKVDFNGHKSCLGGFSILKVIESFLDNDEII